MDLKQSLETLEKSSVFEAWKKEHTDAYLVHFFYMTGTALQIAYYEKDADRITTFTLADNVVQNPASEVFKESKSIAALAFSSVQLSFEDAVAKAIDLQKEKYAADVPTKEIIILQTIDEKPTYNITFVTQTFHFLNIRIDAITGGIISESRKPLMDLASTIE